tara:strand:- start:2815 stop:3138 length:324 start_codon:yes stop_codon:yes gene_type:complete
MVKKIMKQGEFYHVHGEKFRKLIGSRAEVWHKTAYKTAGDLKRSDLMMNKNGRIVSKKKHTTAKKEKRLEKHGYFAKKGSFGFVKKTPKRGGNNNTSGGKKRKTRKH